MKAKFLLALPCSLVCLAGAAFLATGQETPVPVAPKPLKALLVIGGCCHDYAKQKDILKEGLEERANLVVDIAYTPDKSTKATFEIYNKENWAEGYDVVIHDECSADIKDLTVVNRILDAHRKGTPGVNLHCAMHCYRTAPNVSKPVEPGTNDALWFDYLGLQSSGHGRQSPITVTYSPHPATAGLETWTTIDEELYNNIRVYDSSTTLAKGKQGDTETVVAWAHEYGANKTKVWSTTLGHNNETVADPRYLDLVIRGILWTTGKLGENGQPAPGYGPVKVSK